MTIIHEKDGKWDSVKTVDLSHSLSPEFLIRNTPAGAAPDWIEFDRNYSWNNWSELISQFTSWNNCSELISQFALDHQHELS